MTRSSKKVGYHALFIAIILGMAASATVIRYYSQQNYTTKMLVSDAVTQKLLTVHSLSNGLVEVSLIKNPQIIIVNNPNNPKAALINTKIGESAVASTNL